MPAARWAFVNKTKEQKTLPGIAPYQDLNRIAQIIRHRLKKGNAVMICLDVCGSQRDHYTESCNKSDENKAVRCEDLKEVSVQPSGLA